MKRSTWAVLLIGIAGAIAAAVWVLTRPLEGSIDAKVIPQHADCQEPERPVGVVLKNESYKTITWVTFDVGTKRKGYSAELTREKYPTDRIMRPDEEVLWCVRTPRSMWVDGFEYPGQGADVPENELEYFVEIIAADAD